MTHGQILYGLKMTLSFIYLPQESGMQGKEQNLSRVCI